MPSDPPPLPPYGSGTIAEVLPALLGCLTGAPGDPLSLAGRLSGARRLCLLLVDGLGLDMVRDRADAAPTLARLAGPDHAGIRTCFPSTTAASVVSIGTGLTPGEHGFVGYTVWSAEIDGVLNLIQFTRYGDTKSGSVVDLAVPEALQPHRTVFEQASAARVRALVVADESYRTSGLTRAAWRGADYHGVSRPGDLPAATAAALAGNDVCLAHTYYPTLDRVGHVRGPDSDEFAVELAAVDALVAETVDRLPPDSALLVTGDHGMLAVPPEARIDLDTDTELSDGVVALGGEARMRHVHAAPGREADVVAAWRERLSHLAWVATRDEAVTAGWFGSRPDPATEARIGDVVVAFDSPWGVFQPSVDPLAARLVGHHGSFTATESAVPLIVHCT